MRFLRCLFGFLLGLVASALLLYALLPRSDAAFEEAFAQRSHCNVLFVGPSYLRVGVDPELFDSETWALGRPLRACKFTRNALRSYELEHDLGVLMQQPWPALRHVVVDITLIPQGIGFERQNWFSPRVVHWHTWEALFWLGRHYGARRKPWGELAPLALVHLEHVAMNYFSVGRVGTKLSRARWVERRTGREGDHVQAPDSDRLPGARRQDRTDEERELATRQLARDKAMGRRRRDHESDAWPRELEPIIRAAGYQPVFLYSPVYRNRTPPRLTAPGKAFPLTFLDFDDPDRYPELYDPKARGNTSHLSGEGARRWSRILAQEIVKLPAEPNARRQRDRGKRDESGQR